MSNGKLYCEIGEWYAKHGPDALFGIGHIHWDATHKHDLNMTLTYFCPAATKVSKIDFKEPF